MYYTYLFLHTVYKCTTSCILIKKCFHSFIPVILFFSPRIYIYSGVHSLLLQKLVFWAAWADKTSHQDIFWCKYSLGNILHSIVNITSMVFLRGWFVFLIKNIRVEQHCRKNYEKTLISAFSITLHIFFSPLCSM